jgi:L-arabinokinase
VSARLVAYVSGHGFGHATRCAQVLRALREEDAGVRITVVSGAPESLFRAAVPGDLTHRRVECDVGLVQRNALTIDLRATAEACRAFSQGWEDRVEREGRWLRDTGAQAVLGDVPPLAFAAAARAGVPSFALANFSWDWIYRHLSASEPALAGPAAQARAAYAQAGLLLRLPFAGDLSVFPRVEDIPLVARLPRVGGEDARRRLGLGTRPVVLLSFGGIGFEGPSGDALGALGEFDFLVDAAGPGSPSNVRVVDEARRAALGLGYEDVVGAADVVVTKPGYGIVTDAIAGRTGMVYTERGDFPEYPILVAGMARYLPSAHVGNEDLRAGRLAEALRSVLGQPFPDPPPLDGARVAALRIMEMVG